MKDSGEEVTQCKGFIFFKVVINGNMSIETFICMCYSIQARLILQNNTERCNLLNKIATTKI